MVFWHHFVGADMEKENFVNSHVRFYRETGEDFIKMMCDGFVALPDLNVQTPSDWKHIPLPKMTDPFIQDQLTHIKRLREAIQDETAVFYNVFNPVSTLRSSTSDEIVYSHLKQREPALFDAIAAVNDFKKEFIYQLVSDAGVTGVFLPLQNNDLGSFTGDCYYELLRPYDLSLVQEANRLSPYNILHLCGYWGIPNDLENWRDFPGAAIHWDVHTDGLSLQKGREFFPNKKAVMGGFNNKEGSLIYTADRNTVMEKTKEIVEKAGATGLIIGSDCSLLETVDHARVHWVSEALDTLVSR
jgi:hypothetical protein